MAEMGKRRLAILAVSAASKYFFNVINEIIFDEDSDESESEDEFAYEVFNIEQTVKIRGKLKEVVRIEKFVENTIPRFSTKQFQEHFRLKPTVFHSLENKLGHLLLRQGVIGRVTTSVTKQLLATLWLLATPDSYR